MAVMAVTNTPAELYGLSTDTKPTTNVPTGSTFWELDTKKKYFYDGISTWYATV